MTIVNWLFFFMFLLANFTALVLIYVSDKADKRCDEARREADRLKEENEELRNEIRKLEIMNLVKSNLYPKEK